MKFLKLIIFSLVFSNVAFAVGESADVLNVGETLTNPAMNFSEYRAPSGTGVLYNNGSLISSAGTGVGGADESVLENTTLGMTTLGAGHTGAFRVADEFTVSGNGWDVTTITFYAYQTNETASTITAVNLQIWDGVPGAPGSNVVFGDEVTNVMSSTVFSNILRVTETTTGTANNRQIAASTVDVNINLAPGTYWLDWQSEGSGGSGPWAPPITITGQLVTGNALQLNGGVWGGLLDGGSGTALGLPFVVEGTPVFVPPEIIPTLSQYGLLLLLLAMIVVGRRKFS